MSGTADIVSIVKVVKIVQSGGGIAKVLLETGKELFVPTLAGDPIKTANTWVGIVNTVTSEDGPGGKFLKIYKSSGPIYGTYGAVNK